MVSAKTKRFLRRIGWGYTAYHVLVATLLVVSAIAEVNSDAWRMVQFQFEFLFIILVYPALIPAFIACGGLHDHCTTVLGYAAQTILFVVMAACYFMACWVLASVLMKRFSHSRKGLAK